MSPVADNTPHLQVDKVTAAVLHKAATQAAWTHFVKATFAKFSGDRKKAPSPSLTRSIFVTWLNGVPYDTRDSPFLEEMKLSAAEYQTHYRQLALRQGRRQ